MLANKKKILKILILVFAAIIILLGLLVGIYYQPAKTLYAEALAGKDSFNAAQDELMSQQFSKATSSLKDAEMHFNTAKQASAKFSWLHIIPIIGTQFKAIDNILTAGYNIALALQKISNLGNDVFAIIKTNGEVSYKNISAEQKTAILKEIYEAPPELIGAKAEIDLAVLALEQIPETGLFKTIKKAIGPLQEKLPLVKEAMDSAVPALESLPTIAGYPEEKTYLFLLQNNTELRPTGGFIGTYGILKVQNGEIVSFNTDNIYNLDNPAKDYLFIDPPEPIKNYLGQTQWLMRDSNWSPDFPTSAQQAEQFYHLENGAEQNLDGVIAVTPTFISSLLKLTGPITIEDTEFTADNFVEILEYEVEKGYLAEGVSDANRKEIIGTLADKLMEELTSLPKERWNELWKTFTKDVNEKHILLYLDDETVQTLIQEQNWAGEVKATTNDYCMVIDANLAALKTDLGINRSVNYNVNEQDGNFIVDLTLSYTNEGYLSWKTTRYRSYTRIYVPEGSELITSTGFVDNEPRLGGKEVSAETTSELGKTVFGGFITVEPQTTGTINLKYKLPSSLHDQIIANKLYKLYFQKQPGTPGSDLVLNLNLGREILNYSPLDKTIKNGNNEMQFNSDLRIDREFTINLK